MQDYTEFAKKNGVILLDKYECQFCGAKTKRGIHECLEIFSLGFQNINFSLPENHKYRFYIVDAHTLQHPEIHGRWSNHFHLLRLHLIFEYNIKWTYDLSPKLSAFLNKYKIHNQNEKLIPPNLLHRGEITSSDINESFDIEKLKITIENWAKSVYYSWDSHHETVNKIAKGFLKKI